MSGLGTSVSVGGGAARAFFSFGSDAVRHPPIGHGGGEHRDVGRQRRLAGGQHLAPPSRPGARRRPAGRARATGPLTSVTRAPSAASAAAIAWPCWPLLRLAM